MTYCVGILVDEGLVFLADSRTNAGVDQISTFRKIAVFERPGERAMVLMTAGNLAISQSLISILQERIAALKQPKKYSRTPCTLRFFGLFRLALHPLIETLNRF